MERKYLIKGRYNKWKANKEKIKYKSKKNTNFTFLVEKVTLKWSNINISFESDMT